MADAPQTASALDSLTGDGKLRCFGGSDPVMLHYHDTEWGVPVYDGRVLFEHLLLDGAQAGLSWRTILHKRENYRKAFDHFDPQKISRYNPRKIEKLLQDPGIVRNRRKVEAFVHNAKVYLEFVEREGDFGRFLWAFVGGKPIINRWSHVKQMPVTSDESDAMSQALRKLGFKFAGSTICYAFMQAVGMVNDHITSCFRHGELVSPQST